MLFFTPTEELHGANILQRLSTDLQSIKPFLEKIDSDLVATMNYNVKNMAKYLDSSFSIREIHQNIAWKQAAIQGGLDKVHGDFKNAIEYQSLSIHFLDRINMFQDDIAGDNAIDIAFRMNSIYSIKAFVDSLLHLQEEITFRNYVDKALLMMISNGLDVINYVKSDIFFPQIWKKRIIYCKQQSPVTVPFNGHLQDLEYSDPVAMFQSAGKGLERSSQQQDLNIPHEFWDGPLNWNQRSEEEEDEATGWRSLVRWFKELKLPSSNSNKPPGAKGYKRQELFDAEYRYIHLAEIQGPNKISIS